MLQPWWQRVRECSECQAGSLQALLGCTEGAADPRANHPWGSGTDEHNLSGTWGGLCRFQGVEHVSGWLMFACSLCSQQSQGTPLISVSSVTAGGSAGKVGKRPTPNALEDDRGEKFEKSGEALEMGNASGNMEELASGIFLNFCTAHRIPACGVPWGLLTPWSSPSSPRMEPHAGLGWKGP